MSDQKPGDLGHPQLHAVKTEQNGARISAASKSKAIRHAEALALSSDCQAFLTC
jgi:hypothetical protein